MALAIYRPTVINFSYLTFPSASSLLRSAQRSPLINISNDNKSWEPNKIFIRESDTLNRFNIVAHKSFDEYFNLYLCAAIKLRTEKVIVNYAQWQATALVWTHRKRKKSIRREQQRPLKLSVNSQYAYCRK